MTISILDMALGVIIMITTTVAIWQVMKRNRSAGLNMKSYQALIGSDAFKFIFVFLIDLYKAIASGDLAGTTGILASEADGTDNNAAFLHLLDSVKVSLMILALIIPNVVKEESMHDSIMRSLGQAKKDLDKSMSKLDSSFHNAQPRNSVFSNASRSKSDGELPTCQNTQAKNSVKILYSCISATASASRRSSDTGSRSHVGLSSLHRSTPSLVQSNTHSSASRNNLVTEGARVSTINIRSSGTSPINRSLAALAVSRSPSTVERTTSARLTVVHR
ncbi:UNVERIFIED_CONTAM: hypothetical protein HDU68_000796 [Siphonaria sp. JEL0065]|nr:hypothetical protein HDU68_000796 [Siphonaria sp. JEL0065]